MTFETKLTPELAHALTARFLAGESAEVLGKAFDLHPHTVRTAVKSVAGGVRQAPGKHVDPARDAEIRRLYEAEHLSTPQLAERFGLAAPSIRASILRAGGVMRPRGEARHLAAEKGRTRGRGSSLPQERQDELVRRYQAGEEVLGLAKAIGVSSKLVYDVLQVRQIPLRNPDYHRAATPERDQELRRRYEAGESTVDLAREVGQNYVAVSRAIQRAGGTIRSISEARQLETRKGNWLGPIGGPTSRTPPDVEEAVSREYASGATSWALGEKYHLSGATVLRILERNGVQRREGGARGGLTPEQEAEVVKRAQHPGATVRGLAREFGVSRTAIQYAIRGAEYSKPVGRA